MVTHTHANLEVSDAAWKEIADKLRAAGYDCISEDGAIDMHGIALTREEPLPPRSGLEQRPQPAVSVKPNVPLPQP